ncbi:unnamed protein product [Alopecurus aequalis]
MEMATKFSVYRRKLMTRYLETMESVREFEHVKGVPPLAIIFYRDLMETAWSLDRLLPWTSGRIPFDFYLVYLNEYFYRNTPNLNVQAAATRCLDMEEKLSCAGDLPADVYALSNRIKQQAHYMNKLEHESPVVATGFLCIAEEAELMSELLAWKTKNSLEEDVFITEILDDDSFNFSNMVRKTAFDILTTYRGPCSDSIAASLLGMIKEASLVRELLELNENHMDRFARLNLCEYLRQHLLKFLSDINDCKFPELLYGTAPAPATAISRKKPDHAMNSHQDMVSYLDSMGTIIEFEDGKGVLPLDIILYRDLMETTWSSERLLPWMEGYVPFDFYLVYLNEYFYRNTPKNFNVHAAASICLEMENKLSYPGVLLSNRIKKHTECMLESKLESPVAAAGFLCIAEEAELMDELLACKTKNLVENDVNITEVLDDDSLNVSNLVRRTAFDILYNYKGHCSDSIAASLLGMRKEASLLRGLLKPNQKRMDRFVSIKICKSQRQLLLQFLTDIHDSKIPELMTSVSGKESGKAMHCPSTDDGIAVPNPPIATNVTVPLPRQSSE